MFPHRFRRWEPKSEEEIRFFRTLRRGTFKGLFENAIERMMCMARLHVGPLEIDDKGFYRICMRCGHTENYPCWILNRSTGILTK
jgi:hypothetical protein